MEMLPSMHNLAEPVVVRSDRLIVNAKEMFPYKSYRFEFLGVNMVAILFLNPDRVDIFQEVEDNER